MQQRHGQSTKQMKKANPGIRNRCYRWLLRISWQDHVTNKEIHEKIGKPVALMTIIKARKLKLFGHVTRMHDGRLLKTVTFGMVESRRPRGRPPKRWVDDMSNRWICVRWPGTPARFEGRWGEKNWRGQVGTLRGVTLSKEQCVKHKCLYLAESNSWILTRKPITYNAY